jgi:hypothetical protein
MDIDSHNQPHVAINWHRNLLNSPNHFRIIPEENWARFV